MKKLINLCSIRSVSFDIIDQCLVYEKRQMPQFTVSKIPSSEQEAIESPLLSVFEKRRFRNFLEFVNQFNRHDNNTFQGRNPTTLTTNSLMNEFHQVQRTKLLTGSVFALRPDKDYLNEAFLDTVQRVHDYKDSLMKKVLKPLMELYRQLI